MSAEAKTWLEASLDWLRKEFGDELLGGDVLLPDPRSGEGMAGQVEAQGVLDLVCAQTGARRDLIDIEFLDDPNYSPDSFGDLALTSQFQGEAGHFRREGERFVIAISDRQLQDRTAMTAVLAHEMCHVRLIGEDRISARQHDQEQLTDLATVFFGLGVFTSNAAFDYSQNDRGWRTSQLGYLGERLLGYALAYYASLRREISPAWAEHLDTNPRVYMRQGLRYLASTTPKPITRQRSSASAYRR